MGTRRALGRGLEELLTDSLGERRSIAVGRIRPNPHQPRSAMAPDGLEGLAESIRRHGVLQPLVVTASPDEPGTYLLVAGERRLRAAERAGLTTVPVTVVKAAERELLELALVENVQRADLPPLDRAQAYRALQEEFGRSQAEVAEAVGLSRSAVANTLRLLELDAESREQLAAGRITEGHARALLSVASGPARAALLRQILEGGLPVRESEHRAQAARAGTGAGRSRPARPADPDVADLVSQLQRALGTRVEVAGKADRGRVVVHYYDRDGRDTLIERLLRP
ncbi:MAG: ParB/RepB/Spo0J family partition protein [Actinobacteria bacterium]|nr:ParB/RepB/Spo0J family partition protein [Actinomycetota bacterium]